MIDKDGAETVEVLAATAVQKLTSRGLTVATAESLTGGLVCAWLTSVPGASAVVVGGAVVYATSAKATLSSKLARVLEEHGPVAAETAVAMAAGVRDRLGADLGVATTGVAGPSPQDGHLPGTVHLAVASRTATTCRSLTGSERLRGDRAEVREATVAAALMLLLGAVDAWPGTTT